MWWWWGGGGGGGGISLWCHLLSVSDISHVRISLYECHLTLQVHKPCCNETATDTNITLKHCISAHMCIARSGTWEYRAHGALGPDDHDG